MSDQTTTLSDKFSRRGYWWLPDVPDRKIPGLLEFDPDGNTKLVLDGTFRDTPRWSFEDLPAPVILGETINGKMCTLVDVHQSSHHPRAPGPTTSSFFYHKLFLGREFVNPKDTLFESAKIELLDLPGWLNRNPFKDNFKSNDTPQHSTKYIMPSKISIPISNLQASIQFESTFNSRFEYHRRLLHHNEAVRIKPKKKQSLEWFIDVIYKFRTLLSLLVGKPVNITSISLCTKKRKLANSGNRFNREYLDLCLKQVCASRNKALLPQQIPFTYPFIRPNIRKIFKTWFEKADELSTTYSLHFGVTVNNGIPVDFRFLTLIQALEAYHRVMGEDKYVSDDNYARIQTALVDAIPTSASPDLRSALKARIKYGNEFSLRKRLALILKSVPDELGSIITDNDKQFVNKIVDMRNYLTHRDESQQKGAMDIAAMFNSAESLKLLIAFLLLTEIGIERTKVAEVMLNHDVYKNRPRIS